MEQSIFKTLVDQYQTPHPLLGVDGQAFPMIPYSLKFDLVQSAQAFQGSMTMDSLVKAEVKRVKQLFDAVNARGDAQLATRVINELYPLMVEDIQSGNQIAVRVYSPVVDQMLSIIDATQQSQVQPATQEVQPVAQEAQLIAQEVQPAVQEMEEEPIQEPEQVYQEESVYQEELVEPETDKVAQEDDSAAQQTTHVGQEEEPAQVEPNGVPVAPRRNKRTPASAIVLFILGAAFLLAFLLINALPFIGIGTYEELALTGIFDIAIVCVALAVLCCVIAGIILWRSKAKR